MTQDENHTLFENQLPSRLNAELKLADNLGIKPVKVGNAGFDEAINQGTIKWVVTTKFQLVIIPKIVNGQEIPHTVLTRGLPILAGGEAEIAGSNGQYIMLEISNISGHFRPTSDSLEIGKQAFRQQGIDLTTAIETII